MTELETIIKIAEDARQGLISNEDKEKHLKGFMFDSLVFRYMQARDAQMRAEIAENLKEGMNSYESSLGPKHRAKRDKTRFIEILHEAIGEHD